MAELSDFQPSACEEKKKKKKSKRELRERLLNAEASSLSPWSSDHSFVSSGHVEGHSVARRKKEKERREASESQLDGSCVSVESEVSGEAGTGVLIHKKKKKKRVPIQPDDGIHVSQEKTSSSLRMDFQEDTQEELFASSPLSQTEHYSLLFQRKENEAKNLDTSAELGSPLTQKKSGKKRKRSRTEESETTNGLAVEEGVDNTEHESLQSGSSPKQGASEDNNGSANSPTPVREAEEELSSSRHPPSQAYFLVDHPFLKSSEISKIDLETATRELEEFIPHARSLAASGIKQLAQRDLVRFKNFKNEGVAVKFGKFSKKENEQLKKNVEAFLEVSGIDKAEKLFFPYRFPEEKLAINKLKARHFFGLRIAEGIPRPWRLVYYHARKLFDPQNCGREYSRKEIKKLRKYHEMYGNNWKKISELMHRSSHSVAMKYNQIKCKPNVGPWSKQETKQLIQAVEEIIRSKHQGLDSALKEGDADKTLLLMRENLYKGILWTEVEAKVGTRHRRQCKHKWLSIVTKRMSSGKTRSHGAENLQAKINLIERMYELNIEDASEIDWEDLSSAIGNVPPDYVQRRFYKLKIQHVPAWNQKTFPEIIDHLYEVTLPKFKDQLMKWEKIISPIDSEQKKTYCFSDIFWSSDDDLEEEEEK